MTDEPTGPRAVARNNWRSVAPPPLGGWTPELSVTVVIPAKDCQPELDRTLAALAEQTYPEALLDVVVVDDASEPALRLPDLRPRRTTLLRLEPAEGHGSGRGRHAGAQHSDADVLLFLDADMITFRDHVEAHARWHHVLADAVVLGYKHFVDVDGTTAADVAQAVRDERLDELLAGRPWQRHVWVENFIRDADGLTRDAEDLFIAVVGATVSVPRALYQASGGFATYGLRGIVDTEFGYRVFTAGAVLVPEPAARSVHQGARNFAVRGDDIKRARVGLAANRLPVPLFRLPQRGRRWVVPRVRALVPASGATPEQVLLTVDSVLAATVTDLDVTVVGMPDDTGTRWVRDYVAHDPRVTFADERPASGFPSPYTLVVPAGVAVGATAVADLLNRLTGEHLGLLRQTVDGADAAVELWATRALQRCHRHRGAEPLDAAADRLFGSAWVPGSDAGTHVVVPDVTRQGMVYDAWEPPGS